jgi:hypothetical protein
MGNHVGTYLCTRGLKPYAISLHLYCDDFKSRQETFFSTRRFICLGSNSEDEDEMEGQKEKEKRKEMEKS